MRFHFAGFALDDGRAELRSGAERLELEPRAFRLLALLLARGGDVVSKDELFEALWPGTAVTEASLTRLVHLARAALDDRDREQPIIRTLYGRGYQIAVPVVVSPSDRNPTIAILPFENLSGDPDQDYFADGVTEDLITRLARRRHYPVLARTTTSAYRDRRGDLRQVGRELGARYVIEGSVQRRGDRERVTVQLIEAETGVHVWAETYDRDVRDFFTLQDEIVGSVFSALEPELRAHETSRASRPHQNFQAWDHAMRGFWYFTRRTDADTRVALGCFEEAIRLDGQCAIAHGGRAVTLAMRLSRGWEPDVSLWDEAHAGARLAVALDTSDAELRLILGDILGLRGEREEAIREHERALDLDPASPMCHWALGRDLIGLGRFDEALDRVELALRGGGPRDPLRPDYLSSLAQAYFGVGNFEASLDAARQSLASRENVLPLSVAAAACGHLGLREEGETLLEQTRSVVPGFSVALVEAFLSRQSVDSAFARRLVEGLRRAGLD